MGRCFSLVLKQAVGRERKGGGEKVHVFPGSTIGIGKSEGDEDAGIDFCSCSDDVRELE